MQIKHSHLILDACCVLNLYASGNFLSILKTIPAQVVVTVVVKQQELKTLQKLTGENDAALELEVAIQQGLLLVVDFESNSEEETFVNYVFELGDDGESATFAIAFHRRWAVATDDKRATSFFHKEEPNLQIFSTLEIIKYWAEVVNLNSSELKSVLNIIRVKGRYLPSRRHPLFNWWKSSIGNQ
jgi:hypothetical protein